jgi:hypothetical protein
MIVKRSFAASASVVLLLLLTLLARAAEGRLLVETNVSAVESSASLKIANQDVQALVKKLQRDGTYSTALQLLQEGSGQNSYTVYLSSVLQVRPVTLFLATDTAWAAVSSSKLTKLKTHGPANRKFLNSQAVHSAYLNSGDLDGLTPGTTLLSLEGSLLYKQNVRVTAFSFQKTVARGKMFAVSEPNLLLGNKLAVHGVNAVLYPPDF